MASYRIESPETVHIRSPQPMTTVDIQKIREWLPWSIINLFLGWGLGGILPLIFSIICRYNKRANDYQGARTMSNLALIFNILITLGGIGGWIALTILLVHAQRLYRSYNTPK